MNKVILVPIIALALTVLFVWLAWIGLSRELTVLFWSMYVLAILALFVFQLSTLTPVFDLLSYNPIMATIALIIILIVFVIAALFLRWLLDASFIYWAASALFPLASGGLYVIDLFQKR